MDVIDSEAESKLLTRVWRRQEATGVTGPPYDPWTFDIFRQSDAAYQESINTYLDVATA